MNTDPISDFLTRIRNANLVGKDNVAIPYSKIKSSLTKILKTEGLIEDFNIMDEDKMKMINLNLSYKNEGSPRINGLRRISKPGLRVYSRKGEIPRYFGELGVTIVSTSKGIMTHKQAWKERLGGEVICVVW
jgi:small subunit ribosomal protein S8